MRLVTLITSILILCSLSFSGDKQEYILIANKNIPRENLKDDELKKIFAGRMVLWENEVKIDPCYIDPDTEDGQFFFAGILKISVKKFKKYWLKKVFSGYGAAPVSLKTTEAIVEFISENKGGIGVIPKDMVKDLKGCKIIKTF